MVLSFLYSWISSLFIFWPPNFFRFIANTVKSIILSYKILITKFWWIIPVFFGLLSIVPGKPIKLLYTWLFILYFCYICVWVFLSIVVSRLHNVERTYIIRHIKQFFYFLGMGALLFLAMYYSLMIPSIIKGRAGYIAMSVAMAFFISWFFFACLFYADAYKEPLYSTLRGLKMTLYNYPFCWIAANICYGIAYIMYQIYEFVPAKFSIFVSWTLIKVFILVFFSFIFLTIVFVPIITGIFAHFYDKRLREQRKLYFK